MIEWKEKIDAGAKFGICTVRVHTDQEVTLARQQGLNYAHCDGFVNLFRDGVYIGFCGINWAKDRIVDNKKQIRRSIKAC